MISRLTGPFSEIWPLRRMFYSRELNRRIVLLITSQRSGSTLFFNSLLCHPAAEIHRRYTVFDRLGLSGRRFPIDLSNTPDAKYEVEANRHQWDRIPYRPKKWVSSSNRFNVEKFHPHFFQHDVDRFAEKMKLLQRQYDIHLIYLVRDPTESLISFLSYRARNPSWYKHVSNGQVVKHFADEYRSLSQLALRFEGLVVDYHDVQHNLVSSIDAAIGWVLGKDAGECTVADHFQTLESSSQTPFKGTPKSKTLVRSTSEFLIEADPDLYDSWASDYSKIRGGKLVSRELF